MRDVKVTREDIHRVVHLTAIVKAPNQQERETLYRITFPRPDAPRTQCTFEVFKAKPRQSHKIWSMVNNWCETADVLWNAVKERELV